MFGQRSNDNNNGLSGAPALPADQAGPFDAPSAASQNSGDPFAGTMLDGPVSAVPQSTMPAPATAPVSTNAPMPPAPVSSPKPPMGAPLTETSDDLMGMKQEALKQLQPLVGNLQQSPEEEFRTLMMMIQATDDRTMLKKALEAAKKIPDEKARAQAMLDVINEINYFTQAQ